MPICINPRHHVRILRLNETQRLKFTFNYPQKEDWLEFRERRFKMIQKGKNRELKDHSEPLRFELAKKLLVNVEGEVFDPDNQCWKGDTLTGGDDGAIDFNQPNWKEQVSPMYLTQAATWLDELERAEDETLKN